MSRFGCFVNSIRSKFFLTDEICPPLNFKKIESGFKLENIVKFFTKKLNISMTISTLKMAASANLHSKNGE